MLTRVDTGVRDCPVTETYQLKVSPQNLLFPVSVTTVLQLLIQYTGGSFMPVTLNGGK